MNNPANVPPITDMRFNQWDEIKPSIKQKIALQMLLDEEGVSPAELYGEGFTSLEALSRWATSWGITFLQAAQDARYLDMARSRMQQEEEEAREAALKSFIAGHYRQARHG